MSGLPKFLTLGHDIFNTKKTPIVCRTIWVDFGILLTLVCAMPLSTSKDTEKRCRYLKEQQHHFQKQTVSRRPE